MASRAGTLSRKANEGSVSRRPITRAVTVPPRVGRRDCRASTGRRQAQRIGKTLAHAPRRQRAETSLVGPRFAQLLVGWPGGRPYRKHQEEFMRLDSGAWLQDVAENVDRLTIE